MPVDFAAVSAAFVLAGRFGADELDGLDVFVGFEAPDGFLPAV